jgi:hypothetical protein
MAIAECPTWSDFKTSRRVTNNDRGVMLEHGP